MLEIESIQKEEPMKKVLICNNCKAQVSELVRDLSVPTIILICCCMGLCIDPLLLPIYILSIFNNNTLKRS